MDADDRSAVGVRVPRYAIAVYLGSTPLQLVLITRDVAPERTLPIVVLVWDDVDVMY